MTPYEVVDAFVEAINSRDFDRLLRLMTVDHKFVDADGSEHVGRDQMITGWREYLGTIPDYRIEVNDRFGAGMTVVILGNARGTFVHKGELRPENRWSVPAAWRVVVRSDHVAVWQLYANQHEMHKIYERIRSA